MKAWVLVFSIGVLLATSGSRSAARSGPITRATSERAADPERLRAPHSPRASVWLEVRVEPPDAELFAGGVACGSSFKQQVAAGVPLRFDARRPGYQPLRVEVTPHGSAQRVTFTLEPDTRATPRSQSPAPVPLRPPAPSMLPEGFMEVPL